MKKIYLAIILLLFVFNLQAQTVTLNAVLSGKVTTADLKTNGDLTSICSTCDRGYIKYDLTSLPAGASITSASVKFTAIATSTSSANAANKITTTTLDAATAGAGFYAALNTAPTAFTGSWTFAALPNTFTNVLTPAGIADLQNRLASVGQQVTYGVIRGSTFVYTFAGYNNATVANQPQLIINYTIVSPTITYTPLSSVVCMGGNRTLTATITSINGVPTSGIGLPVLYYKINSGGYIAVQGVSIGGNQYTFNFGATAVAGDVVSYYVVAQDGAVVPNVAANPSAGAGGFTANPPAATTPPTNANTYVYGNSLGGTVTVGAGGTFPTITAAVNQYNISCITAPVIMELLDATYPTETFPITINASATATAINNLTVRPAAGVSPLITGSNSSALIKINGADYVTINGSNNGTNSRNLTITNTNASGVDIWIASTANDGAINNTITNTNLSGNSGTTTVGGVLVGGSTFGSAAEVSNNNLTITNNTMIRAQNGIFAIGNATTPDQNWNISGNTIGSAVVADKMGFRGMAVQNAANFTIANNTILGVTTVGTGTTQGILAGGVINVGSINANIIRDIKNTEPTGYGAIGIYLNSPSVAAGLIVSNNSVSDVTGTGFTTGATAVDNGYGIFVGAGAGYSIYYNTVNMNTDQLNAGLPAAFNVAVGVTAVGAIDLRDNIFVNTQTTTGERYSIYSAAPNTVFSNINYNDYATTGANLGFIGVNRATLADIQTGFGGNANSQNVMPVFISATDLHLTPAANTALDNTGTPVFVTTDIDAQARSGTAPDMGVDEFATVLPVTIEFFRGSKQGSSNVLDWKVNCTNEPSVTLILERSADGRNFKAINTQTENATRCLQGFNYTDASPLAGINYYRLKTITPDGNFRYSVIVALLNKDKGFELISVSPNPVRNSAVLSITAANSGKMDIAVSDLTGKIVIKQSVTAIAGNNPVNMNFATLGAGTYTITVVNSENEIKSTRFVKY